MDDIIKGLLVGLGIVVVFRIVALVWEVARSTYFAIAAKRYGWSKEEKQERLRARVRRRWAREERQGERDQIASIDVTRKRNGVNIATLALAAIAFQVNLPWWEAGLLMVAVYVGLTMAVGLSFKW